MNIAWTQEETREIARKYDSSTDENTIIKTEVGLSNDEASEIAVALSQMGNDEVIAIEAEAEDDDTHLGDSVDGVDSFYTDEDATEDATESTEERVVQRKMWENDDTDSQSLEDMNEVKQVKTWEL